MRDTSTAARTMPAGGTPVPEPTEEELRVTAIKRIKTKRDFRSHLFTYVVINIGLWAIWIVSGVLDGWVFPWPLFPTVIWGLFVLGRWYDVFRREPLREELVQREIGELRAASNVRPLDTYEPDNDDLG
jgi:fatty acid desaturase